MKKLNTKSPIKNVTIPIIASWEKASLVAARFLAITPHALLFYREEIPEDPASLTDRHDRIERARSNSGIQQN